MRTHAILAAALAALLLLLSPVQADGENTETPKFKLIEPTQPTKDDPGEYFWDLILLRDQSGFLLVTWFLEPGEVWGKSAPDMEIATYDWEQGITGRFRFPTVRGWYRLCEINENGGFRFTRRILPEDGADESSWVYDADLTFDRTCKLVGEDYYDAPYDMARFRYKYDSEEEVEGRLVTDMLYLDGYSKEHSFKRSAGIEEDVRFFRNVGGSHHAWYFTNDLDNTKLVAVLRKPLTEGGDARLNPAEFWVWFPRLDRARLLWEGPPLGLDGLSRGGSCDWEQVDNTLWIRRIADDYYQCDLIENEEGFLESVSRDGSLPRSEVITIELESGNTKIVAAGKIRQHIRRDGMSFMLAKLDGETDFDIWQIDKQDALRRLVESTEEIERISYQYGIVDYRLVGEAGRNLTHRLNTVTLARQMIPEDLQGT